MTEVAPAVKETAKKHRAGPGRPKGVPNKLTTSAKQAFQLAFDELGGVEGLVRWAKQDDNLGDFYKLYARLIPTDVKVDLPQVAQAIDLMDAARTIIFALELASRGEARQPQAPVQH